MFSFILAAALSQATAVKPVVAPATPVTPVPALVDVATPIPTAAPVAPITEAEALKDGKKIAKNEGREGCVEQTGSRIKRRDKATCNNGRSIGKEDIERAGGTFAPYGAPAIPAAVGN